ncbi:uncharacterized protein BDZ99DRAFT_155342 [Mytilinidion resinicola]|uniref:Secreted protein n=1 Tax=Mytilinidion resinicola TaxID=574789 RepID=A0A6A6Y690_9PEZI|nr:uncharacterized protein BDZ99DRAFT_155342 [Mytilinidion resinicola]KAF2804341.1 hypothetical protein BDZ99DRAFT_155342 [Mytilinidion resinicola]
MPFSFAVVLVMVKLPLSSAVVSNVCALGIEPRPPLPSFSTLTHSYFLSIQISCKHVCDLEFVPKACLVLNERSLRPSFRSCANIQDLNEAIRHLLTSLLWLEG